MLTNLRVGDMNMDGMEGEPEISAQFLYPLTYFFTLLKSPCNELKGMKRVTFQACLDERLCTRIVCWHDHYTICENLESCQYNHNPITQIYRVLEVCDEVEIATTYKLAEGLHSQKEPPKRNSGS